MFMNTCLCYLVREGQYLMLHRTKKDGDMNRDKWIGVGGKAEAGESPEDCVRREVLEETGYTLRSQRFRGIVTFVSGDVTEYMYLYTSEGFEGTEKECNEGDLAWVPVGEVYDLPIWEGDRIFFRLLEEERPFFSLKLVYDGDGHLIQAQLDGERLETVRGA